MASCSVWNDSTGSVLASEMLNLKVMTLPWLCSSTNHPHQVPQLGGVAVGVRTTISTSMQALQFARYGRTSLCCFNKTSTVRPHEHWKHSTALATTCTDDIYREDIVFRDPRNVFRGIKNYRTIFWSLRFHGRIFFRHLYVEILSIWQPEDKQVKMRWKVHGIPRVPWETEGTFNGISTFRLDSHGKVYEHQVDNVIFRDNPPLRLPIFARINLVPGAVSNGGQPCPGTQSPSDICCVETRMTWINTGACTDHRPSPGWWLNGFSWYRLYAAMLLSMATSSPKR